jgi:hypothetical protein
LLAFASFPAAWQEPEIMGINIESDSEEWIGAGNGSIAARTIKYHFVSISTELKLAAIWESSRHGYTDKGRVERGGIDRELYFTEPPDYP